MLGSLTCPIVWTLAIRQVARQLLPRVTPEKEYSEVPHRNGWSYCYIYSDLSRMRRQLSSHLYSGKVPLVYILQSVHYNISTQSFSQCRWDNVPMCDPPK